MPDPSKKFVMKSFVIQSDASDKGMGAVLLQRDDKNNEFVIEYASKAFNKCELRYPTIKKEAKALSWSIKKFHHYLFGRKFLLESDHRPLQWLMSKRDTMGSLGRMALELQQYDFDIAYIPGKQNIVADALSRVYNIDSFISAQEADELLVKKFENQRFFKKEEKGWYKIDKHFKKLCLPTNLLTKRIHEVHNLLNHVGIQKMYHFMKIRYYHPQLKNRIKSLVNSCNTCQKFKNYDNFPKVQHEKQDYNQLNANDVWSIDICDLNQFKSNYRYILTCIDLSTKYVQASCIKNISTSKIISILRRMFKIAKPKKIISDAASQFMSNEFSKFCHQENIDHQTSIPYLHQTNGSIERFFRTLRNYIRTSDYPNKWPTNLQKYIKIYNNLMHSSTGYSPNQLYNGFHEKFETDLKDPIDENIFKINPKNQTIWQTKFSKKFKINNSNQNFIKFNINDHILLRRKSDIEQWSGPFKIVKQISKKIYELMGARGKKIKAHYNQLKPYNNVVEELATVPTRGRQTRKRGVMGQMIDS